MLKNISISDLNEELHEKLSDDFQDKLIELEDLIDKKSSIKYSREEITEEYIDENLLFNVLTYTMNLLNICTPDRYNSVFQLIDELYGLDKDTIIRELENRGYIKKGLNEECMDDILEKIPLKKIKKAIKKYKLKRTGNKKDWLRRLMDVKEFNIKYSYYYFLTPSGSYLLNTGLFGLLPFFRIISFLQRF